MPETIEEQSAELMQHLRDPTSVHGLWGLSDLGFYESPEISLQKHPATSNGMKCLLLSCHTEIVGNDYRVAVRPGRERYSDGPGGLVAVCYAEC